jgi:hypothetical protein
MSITPIENPLQGEQIVGLSPDTRAEAATAWLARPALFAGRALTAPTLQKRQRWQAGRLALRGQALTSGVVRGLEIEYELPPADDTEAGVTLHVAAGLGLCASGEDIVLARPAAISLNALPVYAEPSVEDDDAPPPAPDDDTGPSTLRARAVLTRNLATLFEERPTAISRVGVLVLQPVQSDRLGEFDPTDPCELSACGEIGNMAFKDWRTADGVRAVWYAWPEEWNDLPADGAAFRNEIAWTIFDAEAQLQPGELLPWEMLGLPIALVALDADLQPVFVDRASVARAGGRPRNPALSFGGNAAAGALTAHWRDAPLQQAQLEQLAEEIASAGDPPPDGNALASRFAYLPAAGLLPVNALDMSVLPLNQATETLVSDFFPPQFELDAVPVPLESLDLAMREAAPLARLDMTMVERVRVLVPVPQAVYEPRLLHEDIIDPEFQATLDRFLLDRSRALGTRQGLREQVAELVRLSTGRAMPVPAIEDDPLALEPESIQPWGPPPPDGGHRLAAAAGLHQTSFNDADRFVIGTNHTLYVWTYLNPELPPRMLMFQWFLNDWEHRAYWAAEGDEVLIDWGVNDTVSKQRMGDLPEAGRWVRLEIPAASVGLSGSEINGMAFTLYGGQAAFADTGRIDTAGNEQIWFSNELPTDAVEPNADDINQPFFFLTPIELVSPFDGPFGMEPDPEQNAPLGRHAGITDLLADPALAEITLDADGDVAGGVLSAPERAQLAARGLEGFVAFLKSRADRADDFIDYGFVKVQTDGYRLRQLILGTTNATRLAISPTLAGIAQAETAVASQERIASFLDELNVRPAAGNIGTTGGPTPGRPGAAAGGGNVGGAPVFGRPGATAITTVVGAPNTSGADTERSIETGRAARMGATMMVGGFNQNAIGFNQPAANFNQPAGGFNQPAVGMNVGNANINVLLNQDQPLQFAQGNVNRSLNANAISAGFATNFTPGDVHNAAPLTGKVSIRTTSIAQRLAQPRAEEAKDYATTTRHDAMQSLMRLADQLRTEDGNVTPGLFAGLRVYGVQNDPVFENDAERGRRFIHLQTFINTRARIANLLRIPDPEGDEAAHFSTSVELADTTVALMRQIEGRVKLYRNAVAACERVLDATRIDIRNAQRALFVWDQHLAEARHDVGVARALIAEENERLSAINTRRAEVIRNELRFLAYVRPREAHNLAPTPLRTLDPGLLEAPVPACLEDHVDAPEELSDMLKVLREAPVVWFKGVPKLMEKLDRSDLLIRTLQSAQLRNQSFAIKAAPAMQVAVAGTALRNAIGMVKARQVQTVMDVRNIVSAVNLTALSSLTYQGVRAQVEQVISLGDIIDGEHGRSYVARDAANLFEKTSRITACLHAEFSAVLPAIRLDWAETLSQFDTAPSLRDLSFLDRWQEIAFIDRKQMQAYVDWLFDQVDHRESRAVDLVNDVVRMCLLLAAEAPIGRIIAGRLPRPAVVRPGVRLPLTAFDPAKLRVGMQALVYRGSQVAVRAVIEDIGSEISARVIHTETAEVSLSTDARVQFAEAMQVSLKKPAIAQALALF